MQSRFSKSTRLIQSLLQESFQPIRHHVNKQNVRLKSSTAINFNFPAIEISPSLRSGFIYNTSNLAIEKLENHVQEGLNHFENYKTREAMSSLNKSLDILYCKKTKELSPKEKNLFSQALTCKAKIVRIGSFEDQIIAEKLLDKALEISPGFTEAENLKESMRADRGLPSMRNN